MSREPPEKSTPEPIEVRPRKGWVHLDTDENKAAFLAELAARGSLIHACRKVGCSRSQAYRLREENDEFKSDCEEAMEIYRGSLVQEAHRRAVEGIDKAVIGGQFKNEIILWEKVYSDRLLELLLKRHIPEFRDKVAVEQSGSLAVTNTIDFSKLSDEERDLVRRLLGGKPEV